MLQSYITLKFKVTNKSSDKMLKQSWDVIVFKEYYINVMFLKAAMSWNQRKWVYVH